VISDSNQIHLDSCGHCSFGFEGSSGHSAQLQYMIWIRLMCSCTSECHLHLLVLEGSKE
jgi:hypothetical protein